MSQGTFVEIELTLRLPDKEVAFTVKKNIEFYDENERQEITEIIVADIMAMDNIAEAMIEIANLIQGDPYVRVSGGTDNGM